MSKNWIAGAINPKHKGMLRSAMHVKKGQKIPMNRLRMVAKQSGTTGRRARLAITLRGMHHG